MALDLDSKIVKNGNFTWREAVQSDNATRVGILNIPGSVEQKNIIWTAQKMEIIRVFGGNSVISPSSWYRSPKVNALANSKPTSAHVPGFAVDHNHWGTSPRQWWNKLATKVKEFEIDQLILEFDNWVHVGFRGPGGIPRHEIFKIGC